MLLSKRHRGASSENLMASVRFKMISPDERNSIQMLCQEIEQSNLQKKQRMSSMKIWEKRTKSMLKPLQFRKFSNTFTASQRENKNTAASVLAQLEYNYPSISRKDEEVVKSALRSIVERREEKATSSQARESIFQRVERTKEIHLIRLTASIIRGEIEGCRAKATQKALAIAENEKGVREDFSRFFEGFQAKKSEVAKQGDAIRELTLAKNDLISAIKSKNSELQILSAENKKSAELIEGLRELQLFIDKLMPPPDREKKENEM